MNENQIFSRGYIFALNELKREVDLLRVDGFIVTAELIEEKVEELINTQL